MEDWVICRIFLKNRVTKHEEEITKSYICEKIMSVGENGPVFYDFLGKEKTDLNLIPVSSSSDSSGVTEVSSHESSDHDHEESSSCYSFSSIRRKPLA